MLPRAVCPFTVAHCLELLLHRCIELWSDLCLFSAWFIVLSFCSDPLIVLLTCLYSAESRPNEVPRRRKNSGVLSRRFMSYQECLFRIWSFATCRTCSSWLLCMHRILLFPILWSQMMCQFVLDCIHCKQVLIVPFPSSARVHGWALSLGFSKPAFGKRLLFSFIVERFYWVVCFWFGHDKHGWCLRLNRLALIRKKSFGLKRISSKHLWIASRAGPALLRVKLL